MYLSGGESLALPKESGWGRRIDNIESLWVESERCGPFLGGGD